MSWANGQLLGFDTETTAKEPMEALPVSFALVLRRNATRMSRMGSLVNPGVPIPPEATAIHGITDEMVQRSGMPLDEAMEFVKEKLFWAQLMNIPVVGMNLPYDCTIVHRLADLTGWRGRCIDIFVLDKAIHKWRKGSRRLGALADHYGVSVPEEDLGRLHSADADAALTILVLEAMVRKWPWLAAKPIDQLHHYQEKLWADQQRESLSEYFVEQGQDPIPWEDYGWPIKKGALVCG